ncbi:MAG: Phosphodiesterase, MJ0936 family [Candidatus Woesebacteria bacterium GW2011_GWC2_33_12]|uniref:Phosphoesterase n=1 Tax=Candidatus Woesebacteria bacterium GW2011_GWB1_33_22 TaxID=1618566 RepID=A0A0F9ZL41_9BACT|nr:MAG: Phosphodiesterase, MJ0936 family [Candidatus Woesebacteria bacterium GW2011_GWC2_33_12]KKP42214.1 MAG: Phosphodiesterase, MJ0936 family [Candidatus Woesebacteria bacterium GW2011_GWA2_33_20]KKP44948.1 MAG: Phosphodiesterase, MJ0936 family [Candidatus Woesebacteria bacterium GW2011_GWB1_33_22]KKP46762.1 MAG: Phosphodiesterase, MJ0936 family [Microgenomates group bacterium GW2011_GWC1_33_28]KKP50662.1 MAG: Phosphodiesterase, MJ0936 family [Candidatus Woesebacteria bacterium GW2011_GWA1_33
MKILIIGDSHNNLSNLRHVMGFAKKNKAGAIIHTGDWGNFDNVKSVSDYGIPLYSCLGNADIDPNFKFEEFVKIEIDGVKIGIIHNIKKLKENREKFDIVFCGHTHKQNQEKNVINPGALENGINFAIYDTKTNQVEFMHE